MSTATLPVELKSTETPRREISVLSAGLVVGLALFSSGAAGLVNQVVWQRSLKVFLGGSESISSMVVVLVFMGGLGIGSIWMGARAARLRRPLMTFGLIEAALAIVNIAVCALLAADISHSVFHLQTLALSAGVPLLAMYAVGAIAVLIVPCLLMGATMPLAAEACQRSLGLTDSRMLGLLFFVNTLGSVAGTLVSSGYMIAQLGQANSLVVAAAMNLIAGGLLLTLALKSRFDTATIVTSNQSADRPKRSLLRPSTEEILALGLGFCSLGYEMYLFRLLPLRHQPLPFTFAAVLTGFLLFWSLGAALSSYRRRMSLQTGLRICALTCAASIGMYLIDRPTPIFDTWSLADFVLLKMPYFIPALLFGYLFALVASRAAKSWGADIGRVYGWNTLGCCLGIVGMTLVGYEMPFFLMVVVIALLLYAMQEYVAAVESRETRNIPRWAWPLAASGMVVAAAFTLDVTRLMPGVTMYSGRDGVILLDDEGNMMWDGLWHSKLSDGGDHVGTNNWYLGVCPALCHPTGEIEDVCIIGVATGITASTLARLDTVEGVDGYDISHVLKRIYRDHPEGTLHLATNPKIDILWQDARTGLALSDKKYDIIQTQPLYLKQAGSALLNSEEFYRLIAARLKPGGVFCLYSNGTAEQAFVVRETADRVFPYRESFFDGYLVILSNDPIDVDAESFARRIATDDPMWAEVRGFPATSSGEAVMELLDRPRLSDGDGQFVITDDHPIVEYPHFLAGAVHARLPDVDLPTPKQGKTRDE